MHPAVPSPAATVGQMTVELQSTVFSQIEEDSHDTTVQQLPTSNTSTNMPSPTDKEGRELQSSLSKDLDAENPTDDKSKDAVSPRRQNNGRINPLPDGILWTAHSDRQVTMSFSSASGIYSTQETIAILISAGWLYEVTPTNPSRYVNPFSQFTGLVWNEKENTERNAARNIIIPETIADVAKDLIVEQLRVGCFLVNKTPEVDQDKGNDQPASTKFAEEYDHASSKASSDDESGLDDDGSTFNGLSDTKICAVVDASLKDTGFHLGKQISGKYDLKLTKNAEPIHEPTWSNKYCEEQFSCQWRHCLTVLEIFSKHSWSNDSYDLSPWFTENVVHQLEDKGFTVGEHKACYKFMLKVTASDYDNMQTRRAAYEISKRKLESTSDRLNGIVFNVDNNLVGKIENGTGRRRRKKCSFVDRGT